MVISFPLFLPLVLFGLVVAAIAFYAFLNIEHLIRYGETTGVSFSVTFAWLAGTALIFFFTWQLLQGTDWKQLVTIGSPDIAPTLDFQNPTPLP